MGVLASKPTTKTEFQTAFGQIAAAVAEGSLDQQDIAWMHEAVNDLAIWKDDITLAAYTADDESAAYSSTPAALTDAATLVDLNALRTAYENLRAAFEDLRTQLDV